LRFINQPGASAFAEPSLSSTDGTGGSVRRTEIELSQRAPTLKHGLGSDVLDKLVASGFLSDELLDMHGTLRIVTTDPFDMRDGEVSSSIALLATFI
jgi:hypothetical protein